MVQKKLIASLKYCAVQPGTKITAQAKKGDKMFIIFSGTCCAYAAGGECMEKGNKFNLLPITEQLGQPETPPVDSEPHENSSGIAEESWGEMTLVETLSEGETFGESALVGMDRKYIHSVLAAVHVELLVLESSSFQIIFGDVGPTKLPWLSEIYRAVLKRCSNNASSLLALW